MLKFQFRAGLKFHVCNSLLWQVIKFILVVNLPKIISKTNNRKATSVWICDY